MKSIRQKKRNRIIPIVIAIAVLLAGIVAGYYLTRDADVQDDSRQNDGNQAPSETEKPAAPNEQDDTDDDRPAGSEDDDFVGSPNRPVDDDENYPIETPHYRIDQKSGTSYKVTLYPLVNSPDADTYDEQLRQYKQEALDYLERRYGDVSQFNFEWEPDRAKSV